MYQASYYSKEVSVLYEIFLKTFNFVIKVFHLWRLRIGKSFFLFLRTNFEARKKPNSGIIEIKKIVHEVVGI